MKETNKMYQSIQEERKRFLTYQFMHRSPNDVEEMVQALYGHFEIIHKTCFEDRAKENHKGLGSYELLQQSNKELANLEKELKSFQVQKDDLRFDLYKMILDMLTDNIQLRQKINLLLADQFKTSERRLDRHAQN